MSSTSQQAITDSHSQVQHPASKLRRRDLKRYTTRIIHQGRGYQSTVYLVEIEGQRAAVKDFSGTPPLFRRWVAPYLVRRELRALQHLQGVPGVPQFYGSLDRLAFAMEYIEGTPIAQFSIGELAPEVFPRVQNVIDGIHQRGVAHGDLKRRSNLILTPQGEIYLIDFAAATIGGRPFHPFANWLQKQMAAIDDKALPRLKRFVAPELLTEADQQKLDNPTTLEKLARRLLNR
jgi:predicted Ser/Thr protein kinase